MSSSPLHQARFLISGNSPATLGYDFGMEFAFVGRSNSGKSTVINNICRQKELAHSSSRPGKTRLINLFSLAEGDRLRLGDLPGYGYARTSQAKQQQWEQELTAYILERKSLSGIVVVMDIRHPLTRLDKLMLKLAANRQCPLHILLNKSDKLSHSRMAQTVQNSRLILKNLAPQATLSGFTSKGQKRNSPDEFRKILQDWLNGTFQSKIKHEELDHRRNKTLG